MRIRWPLLLVLGGWFLAAGEIHAAAATIRLSRVADTYFMEDDRVYARFLWFRPDGSYRQINRDRTLSEEVDRGTWLQAANGEVALQPTNGMLSYRALSAGPLLIILATQEQIDGLGALRQRVALFLEENRDMVFARESLGELNGSSTGRVKSGSDGGCCIMVPDHVESFDRSDLEDLLHQITSWLVSRNTNRFLFDLVAPAGWPLLLIQRGAVFSRAGLPDTRSGTPSETRGKAPAFYFAQVSRQVFVRAAGNWKPFENLGGLHEQAPGSSPTP